MTRYERSRNQNSRIWRKRRKRQKANNKYGNIQARNRFRGGSDPDIDTSLKASLMQRVLEGVAAAMTAKRRQADNAPTPNYQQQQAR